MKIVLACLMCLVLGSTECLAIDGGPWSGSGAPVTTTGNYAGVLLPIVVTVDPGPPPVTLPPDNSIVLFTMSVAKLGLATGVTSVFRNGLFYPGTITGLADPDSAKVYGVLAAAELATTVTPAGTTTTETGNKANGQLDKVKIIASSSVTSSTSTRMRGTASLTYVAFNPGDPIADSGGPIQYRVRAFKQSEATS